MCGLGCPPWGDLYSRRGPHFRARPRSLHSRRLVSKADSCSHPHSPPPDRGQEAGSEARGDPLRAEAAAQSGLWPSARGSSGTACRKRGRLPHGVPERSAETPSAPGALTVSSPCATRSTGLINDFVGDPSASRRPHFPLCLMVQPPREKPHLLTPNHHHGKGVIKPGPGEASRKEEQRLSPAAWVPPPRSGTGVTAVRDPSSRIPFEGVRRRAWRTQVHQLIKAGSDVGDTGPPPRATAGTRGPARCHGPGHGARTMRSHTGGAPAVSDVKRNEGPRPLHPPQTWHPPRLRQGTGIRNLPLNNLTRPSPPSPF